MGDPRRFELATRLITLRTPKDAHTADVAGVKGHRLGTMLAGVGTFALGLPKGFCRPGFHPDEDKVLTKMNIRLWPDKDKCYSWDNLNVPVWAMEKDGYLFVRTLAPRVNICWVDVIKGGTLSMVPNAIDVSKFIDEID